LLPFLKKKPAAAVGVIVKTRTPDEKPEQDQDDSSAGIEACAHDLLTAIEAKDVKGIADALQAAFEIADSQPHEEGEHTNESETE
jgi:hypothetical protein